MENRLNRIRSRISQLRTKMKAAGIDCYLIPTSDAHDSEYVSSFFMVREYFSGFTGSAGTLVVTADEAALFTDGRYFIQAQQELEGTGIQLMKVGEPGVPTICQYLELCLKAGQKLAFDGRVVKADDAKAYEKILKNKNGKIIWNTDPAEDIWTDRPQLLFHPVFTLEKKYSGEEVSTKLKRVREKMQEAEATVHILTSLDDIAWLYNIRGNDVKNCPVVLAFTVVTQEKAILFTGADENKGCFHEELRAGLEAQGIEFLPYADFYEYTAKIHDESVLLCEGRVNYRLIKELQSDVTIIDRPNPTTGMKAVKNVVEMENLRKAHIKDAVAVTKFIYWLKKNVNLIPMTEWSVQQKLEEFRSQQENFLEPSFDTISAYGVNGAIIHYSCGEDDCAQIYPRGLLMVDSGGHYLEGSTDITRTLALGPVTAEMKKHYTLVLLAMLRLKNTRFLYGCRGVNLDIRAREVLWEHGLDYRHGTGHGVGYLLNVHEGPNSFRWKLQPDYQENAVLEEGMVTTDEPGIYIEGSHGIRIENELLCRKDIQNEYGQFMYFEDLTCVPIDLEAVEPKLLGADGIKWLNDYHRTVYQRLEPYFEGEELRWLQDATGKVCL